MYFFGSKGPGKHRPPKSTSVKQPPLLQRYNAPSGPMAAPFGPPAISATVSLRPSGHTRVMRGPNISTRTTLPSFMAIGPSGNLSPEVTSVNDGAVVMARSCHDRVPARQPWASSSSTVMSTSRALLPVLGPTTPRSSRRSMMRPARAKPTLSLRWSIEVDPSCERTTSSMA